MPQHDQPQRTPELDGIRGIAILMVLCFHVFKRADQLTQSQLLLTLTIPARVGWAGVDIFFVLSGFLITTILLRTTGRPHYFKNFYVRRILRIFPLYYLCFIVFFLLLGHLDPYWTQRAAGQWPFFVIYQQNWLYATEKNGPSEILGVSWSLAIEEQFYLIWPAVVRIFSKRRLVFICIGVMLFSLLTRIAMMLFPITGLSNEEFFYFGSLTRFEGLAAGGLVAIVSQSSEWLARLGRVAKPGFIFSVVCFGIIVFVGGDAYPVSANAALAIFGYTLLALIGATLVLMALTGSEKSWFRSILRNRVLSFFGKYSYAIYLLHMPIVVLLWVYFADSKRQSGEIWLIYVLTSFSLTIIASLLSWNLFEKHILRLKEKFE